jgi:hypothetical protein
MKTDVSTSCSTATIVQVLELRVDDETTNSEENWMQELHFFQEKRVLPLEVFTNNGRYGSFQLACVA